MSTELARSSLSVLKAIFLSRAATTGALVHKLVVAEDGYRDRLSGSPDVSWKRIPQAAGGTTLLRLAETRFVNAGEREYILNRNPNAVFEKNSSDEPVYYHAPFVLGNSDFRGDHSGYQEFQRLARDAGRVLPILFSAEPPNLNVPDLIGKHFFVQEYNKSGAGPEQLWIVFLHCAGWQEVPGSPLFAERKIWQGNTSFLGDPKGLAKVLESGFPNLREGPLGEIPIPPPFFESKLQHDVHLASAYAIDLILSEAWQRPSVSPETLTKTLLDLPPGPEFAQKYHNLIAETLSRVFFPDLRRPAVEQPIDQGHMRADIIFDNRAEQGFFYDLTFRHGLKCPIIFVECKNLSTDLANEDFDQIAGRLDDKRGQVGLLLCRKITNTKKCLEKCQLKFGKSQLILVLTDDAVVKLLELSSKNDRGAISDLLRDNMRPILLNK